MRSEYIYTKNNIVVNLSTLEIILGVITIISTMYGVYAFIHRKAYKEGVEDINLTTLEKKVDDLPCKVDNDYLKKRDRAYEKIDNLPCKERGDKIEAMSLDIRELLTLARLNPQSDKNPTIKDAVTAQNSPRVITEFGRHVYNESGSDVFYAAHKELLLEDMVEHNPTTKLDVENMSLRVLLSRLSEDIFKPLKDWVYENPYLATPNGEKEEIIIDTLCLLISLELRDEYIKLHNIE